MQRIKIFNEAGYKPCDIFQHVLGESNARIDIMEGDEQVYSIFITREHITVTDFKNKTVLNRE